MGNAISCCPDESMKQGVVLVMKEDGETMKFKDATPVKDVLAAHPYHKIVRCCSERTVVSATSYLSCNSFYFLLPKKLAPSDATYQSLVKAAASKRLVSIEVVQKHDDQKTTNLNPEGSSNNQNGRLTDQKVSYYENYGFGYKWKPLLKTIPEIASPPVHTNVKAWG